MPEGQVGQLSKGSWARVALDVPCGKCTLCLSMKSAQWAVRAYHESQLHEQNCFITLTYSDEHYPMDGKISKEHLNEFWRELRRLFPPRSIRYLACGEYGEQSHRAHYHALIFGADFRDGHVPTRQGGYTNPVVEKIWGRGLVDITSLSVATCCYVAGYATKKIGNPDTFVVMSRMPGLGRGWIDKYRKEVNTHGAVVIDGRTFPIPKRYFDWCDLKELQDENASTPRKFVSEKTRQSRNINAVVKAKQRQEKL